MPPEVNSLDTKAVNIPKQLDFGIISNLTTLASIFTVQSRVKLII